MHQVKLPPSIPQGLPTLTKAIGPTNGTFEFNMAATTNPADAMTYLQDALLNGAVRLQVGLAHPIEVIQQDF